MNILLVTDSYPPEIRSASHLMQELAEYLQNLGHSIYVATSYPQYNLSQNAAIVELPEYTNENDIKVLRVKTLPHHKVNFIIRGIAQLTMPHLFYRKIKKHIKDNIDIVIVYSPPLTLASIGKKMKSKYSARSLLSIQDIFPQNAIDLGVLNNKFLIWFFEHIEKEMYKACDKLIVHSEGNRRFMISRKNQPESKTHVIHNWIDTSFFANASRTGKFRSSYGLTDSDFVILFAGVIGPSQGLDIIIEAAAKVKHKKNIRFLFVGDGTEKSRLQRMADDFGLSNVVFAPFVSKKDYPALVKDSDIGLVCLTSKNKTPVVPGKILGYMAAGIPILAFLQKESDGHSLINQANCGYTAISDNPEGVAQLTLDVYERRQELPQLGTNGQKFVTQEFSIEKAIEKLTELF